MTTNEYNKSVDKYGDRLYAFALKALKDDNMAKDIVQESFLRLWENRDKVKNSKIKPYLFTIAYHLIVDETRYKKRFESLYFTNNDEENEYEIKNNIKDFFHDNCSYHEKIDNFDLKLHINNAINTLPDMQKKILKLRDEDGYSYKEIADYLNISETKVKVYLHRGRQQIKEIIGKIDNLL
ncbi:MAG: RNA polymerase sigma factor [Bacteroidales bacterium]|jgi:RNA polymerase sigma-70 factor (ECF subfamily)|nr:RNA polymerase sigma factor [Bacteroidales bacterium]MDI9574898.1 RNA polymerase sigma factor [Bacteroidota bacterium]MDY0400538.1 RNA polymerase sigma factor [Bacteroidales bacterium]HPZ60979.1 RNA polymerase sigma factor [Bacteroidales bacterium]